MGGTYYTLETGALKVMEDFFVYAKIFSVKKTTDNTDLFGVIKVKQKIKILIIPKNVC